MNISLYYKDSKSDKQYNAQIAEADNGYLVNFQYGRRGGTLATGTKTTTPVDKNTAEKIFNKLIREKKAKGYTEGEAGTPYLGGNKEDTGIHCQLLTPIVEEHLESFFQDGAFVAQEKMDGKRILLKVTPETTIGINRSGLECGIPETFKSISVFAGEEFIIDGEAIGDTYHAFDILQVTKNDNLKSQTFLQRRLTLNRLVAYNPNVVFVPIAIGENAKRVLFNDIKQRNGEGIVFKRANAPYRAGRGDDQFKFKFQAEATCEVIGVHPAKRSFSIGVLKDGELVNVGNVTVPANKDIPTVGQFVEVRYLYCLSSLVQPFFKGVRDDKTEADQYETLKFKGE